MEQGLSYPRVIEMIRNNHFFCGFWANDLDSSSVYTDTAWHHWACAYDASTRLRTLYRDGAQVAQDTASANYQGAGDLLIGSRAGVGWFQGAINNVRVYHRALPAADVAVLATGSNASSAGLVADWPLREGSGSLAHDQTAYHHDGVISGATWQGGGEQYTVYHTSAWPNDVGLTGTPVLSPGVQVLTVTSAHPLVLFNLDVSLEWDAWQDAAYNSQLEFNLKRASDVLYDITNGQAALGQVNVYYNRQRWNSANLRLYATNQLRPHAGQGGLVTHPVTDPLATSVVYWPGQVSLGATWNRYGNAGATLGDDWPRTLAHELGHYLLYLGDNYLGVSPATGLITPTRACTGTIMTDSYRDDYSELRGPADWLPACADTLSNQATGRSDWVTVQTFYPALHITSNAGPKALPLAVAQVNFIQPLTPTNPLPDARFYLKQNGASVQPGPHAQAYLLRGHQWVSLGRPVVDQVLARGAQPGDRVCVIELDANRQGCKTVAPNDNQELELTGVTDW